MLVDSHCHLNLIDLEPFDGELKNAVDAAIESGISHMLCVNCDLPSFPTILEIAKQFENVSASVGVHPNEPPEAPGAIESLLELGSDDNVVAIGETGLDYYRTDAKLDWQHERFRTHIHAAKELSKPLIVHTRQAREDTIKIMREENAEVPGGVLHCFTENWDMAKKALDIGFYISFSGIITFKNTEELRDVVKKVPIENLLIETDAPYLTPVPFRGKANQPAYVKYVAECIAELKGMSYEEVAHQTTQNFFSLFKHAKHIKA